MGADARLQTIVNKVQPFQAMLDIELILGFLCLKLGTTTGIGLFFHIDIF